MTAVPSPGDHAVPLHRRSIDYRAYVDDDDLVVVGRLTDSRPWAEDGSAVAIVHDMELRVRVGMADLVITGATAEMHAFPHTECPTIETAFAGLVGLSVARGYTREVQARFGGPRGCTHLEHLARCTRTRGDPIDHLGPGLRRQQGRVRGHSGRGRRHGQPVGEGFLSHLVRGWYRRSEAGRRLEAWRR